MQKACPEGILEAPPQGGSTGSLGAQCRNYELQCIDKWYDHQPLQAVENRRDVRITWDMTILSDRWLKHNRPNITVVLKDTQE